MKSSLFYQFYVSLCLLLFSFHHAISQINENTDLKKYNYNELAKKYYENIQDTLLANQYINEYITRARLENNIYKIADVYYIKARTSNRNDLLKYGDSIVELTQKTPNNIYPAYGYLIKANYYFNQRNFIAALDEYVLALEYSEKSNNSNLAYYSKHSIGLLKSRIGEYDEALAIFLDNLKYKEENNLSLQGDSYLSLLFALSDTYMRISKLDSASYFNKIGFQKSQHIGNDKMKNYFIMNEGANQFWKKNYGEAIDSLTTSLNSIKENSDNPNLAFSYYYIGKSHYALNDTLRAINYLKKIDSVFYKISDIHPEIRNGYEILIDYYKDKKDTNNQLIYIEKLLKVDSVLNNNYKHLITNINEKFDTPTLIKQKEQIIIDLSESKKRTFVGIIILLFLVLFISLMFFHKRKREHFYKKKFEALYNEKDKNRDVLPEKKESVDIPEHIVLDISLKLEKFEKDLGYLDQNLNSNFLAKRLKTNAKYLSKVINQKESKNFIEYVNDLRIDYAVQKMKTDNKFQNYTIKAISESVGFNNQNSFSRAFVKKTGIKPSYFLKELEKKQEY